MKLRKEKGITLIALVVTIIILIILTGVSINLVFGQYGIVNRTKEAKKQTEIEIIKEEIKIEILEKKVENNRDISDDTLKEILEKYGVLSKEEELIDKTLTTTKGNYEIKVSDILKEIIKEEIPIESIEVTPKEGIIQVGERKILTVKVLPNNATNKKITWKINEDSDIFLIEKSEEIREGEYKLTILGKKTGNATINFYEKIQDSTSKILLSYNLEVEPIVFENAITGYDNGSSSDTFTHEVKVLPIAINTNDLKDIINYSDGKFTVLKKCIISFTGTAISTTPNTITHVGYYKNGPIPSGVDQSTYINWNENLESFENVRISLEEGEYFYLVWKSMSTTAGCAGADYKGKINISVNVIVDEW